MIAQVIVDVVHTNVDRPFSYRIPEGMAVEQGSRVSVPLGKRRVDGFVVSLLEEDQLPADVPLQKLRPIAAVLDDYPALLPQLLTLLLPASPEEGFISSSAVREIAYFGGDITPFVPAEILEDIKAGLNAD